jgi:hypothetical protein
MTTITTFDIDCFARAAEEGDAVGVKTDLRRN